MQMSWGSGGMFPVLLVCGDWWVHSRLTSPSPWRERARPSKWNNSVTVEQQCVQLPPFANRSCNLKTVYAPESANYTNNIFLQILPSSVGSVLLASRCRQFQIKLMIKIKCECIKNSNLCLPERFAIFKRLFSFESFSRRIWEILTILITSNNVCSMKQSIRTLP